MDGDLQHPAETIKEMVRIWEKGNIDIIGAVKKDRGHESLVYRFLSEVFFTIFKSLSGVNIKNKTDFCLLDAKVVKILVGMSESNFFFRGIYSWIGFSKEYVYFDVQPRRCGTSRWNQLKLVKWAIGNIISFSSIPLHIITYLGVIFLTLGLVLGVRITIIKMEGLVIDGITTLILLTIIIGSLIMIALGIIGEYLAEIYMEVKRRPKYLIAEVKKVEAITYPSN